MVGCRSSGMPNWLVAMLRDRFFGPCAIHGTAKKSEKNIFCLDCCVGFCPQCFPVHRPHRLLQVRRYVYHDVVRVEDMEKLIDCSLVQSYITNSAKVIFLNERPQGRPFRGGYNACLSCYRALQEPYLFCCLNCKVKQLLRSEGALWRELRECVYLPLPSSCELDEGQLTPDSILESTSATSSGSAGAEAATAAGMTTQSTAGTETPGRRKKRSESSRRRPGREPDASEAMNRRKKGVPVRSPLF